MSCLALVLAEATASTVASLPTWTDKEVLGAFASYSVGIASVVLGLLRYVTRTQRQRVRELESELRKQRAPRNDAPPEEPQPQLQQIESQLQGVQLEITRLLAVNAETSDRDKTQRLQIEHLQRSLGELQSNVLQYEQEINTQHRRIKSALGKDGQTWNERVLHNAPDFKALDPEIRRTPILSVLNLKGGVGKTTISANLAAALDGLGYRVLVLDLDLQGSLTGLFLSEDQQEELTRQGKLLESFLRSSFGAEYPSLLDYAQPVLPTGKSALVPTSDDLVYTELNMTMRWMLREGNRDVRFLLRRELHLKRVTNKYDVILLDCPPLINVCCVNALAASDYLLIPVMPSKQATARVPVLLERLKEFREMVNPALKVMGVIANRTSRSELTLDEQSRLRLLSDQCRDIWGESVPLFETFIRQSTAVREAEDQNRPLRPDDSMYPLFCKLAREIESRLPTFCRVAPQGTKEVVS